MSDTTLTVQPKPVQDRPLGENLHKDLHSYPCPGTKSPEIQDVTVSREALKIRCPQGRPGSTPGPGTCGSSNLGRGGGGRSGGVSPNVSPIAFATFPSPRHPSCRHREPRDLAGRARRPLRSGINLSDVGEGLLVHDRVPREHA